MNTRALNVTIGAMAGKVAAGAEARADGLSAETLETCRLLVEFLHAAYAARRESDLQDPVAIAIPPHGEAAGDGDGKAAGRGGRRNDLPSARRKPPSNLGRVEARPMSSHAVRAAVHVHEHGERTIGELAAGLGISYGWASRVVDELETAHYVVRQRDVYDHRIVRIRLDPTAVEAVERAYRWRERDVQEALQPLSEEERGAVRTFLRGVTEKLRGNGAERSESGGQA
jgi:DNA-binding MarR family transcriptional regulator